MTVGAADSAAPIKVLLIEGGNAHDYAGQIKLIKDGLSARINVDVTVEHQVNAAGKEVPGNTMIDIYKKADWTKGYDVVIHNECYAEVADKDFVESIAKAHSESGVAGVVIHGTLHAYRSADKVTDAWRLFLGVTSVRHEKGGQLLKMKTVKADSPVVMGLPAEWTLKNEELYVIAKEWPNCVPLISCQSNEDPNKSYTVAWTNTCGKARVFGTSLGHPNATFQDATYLELLANGVLWAADKLDEKGKPKPGYEAKAK
jgi:type 1 glutamine amidotransferase